MRKVLSRKKLTEAEALEKISHLFMQLQNEQEALTTTFYPNRHKAIEEMDRTTQLILILSGHKCMEDLISETENRISTIKWKIFEDYGRYVSEGVHSLSSGHTFAH